MEPSTKRPSPPPEFHLSVSADRGSIKDVVKGRVPLHPTVTSNHSTVLTTSSLPALLHTIFFHRSFTPLLPSTHEILDLTLPYLPSQSTLIDTKVASLSDRGGKITVQFLEKKRKKGWFVTKADEETVWESWVIDCVVGGGSGRGQLRREALKVVEICMRERNHIPPITTNEKEPFPYNVVVSSR